MTKAMTLAGEESTFGGLIRNLEFLSFGGIMKGLKNFRLQKMSWEPLENF